MKYELFSDLPDIIDAKILAEALKLSKSGTYALMADPGFPVLKIGGRKLVTKPDLIEWVQSRKGEK